MDRPGVRACVVRALQNCEGAPLRCGRTTIQRLVRVESHVLGKHRLRSEGGFSVARGSAEGIANGRFCSTAYGSREPELGRLAGIPHGGQGLAAAWPPRSTGGKGVALLSCSKSPADADSRGPAAIQPIIAGHRPRAAQTGHATGNFGVSRGSGASCVQAGDVRHAGRACRARHRAGRHAETGGKVRRETRGRAADAVSAHFAEHDPRPLPAAEGQEYVDDLLSAFGRGDEKTGISTRSKLCTQNPTRTPRKIPRGNTSKLKLSE